jgi:hypothetical protein
MGVVIWGPAAGFSLVIAIFLFKNVGVIASVASVFIIFFLFYRCRLRILMSLGIYPNLMEVVSLGGRAVFDYKEIKSCSAYGLRTNVMLFVVVRISGRRLPLLFHTGVMSTSAGGYTETIKSVKLMMDTVNGETGQKG